MSDTETELEGATTDLPKAPDVSASTSLDLNGIATVGAVILSIVAISISLLEVFTLRTHQRASVWPYLQIASSYSREGFAIMLENKGVGPAIVERFQITLDDEPTAGIDQLIVDVVGQDNAFSYDNYNVANPSNSVVSASEELRLFSFQWDERTRLFELGARDRVNIEICYCSIHKDCWLAEWRTNGVEDVKSCK